MMMIVPDGGGCDGQMVVGVMTIVTDGGVCDDDSARWCR